MLPDVLAPGLKVVFCGSAAGKRSAAVAAYYAGPGNQFWKTLALLELTPEELEPGQYRRLLEFGIGLTDLVKDQSGNDAEVRFQSVDRPRLEKTIREYQPRLLCFNGKRAAMEYFGTKQVEYGLQPSSLDKTRLFVAPSTSGAARKHWDLSVWESLAALVREPA